MWRQDNTAFLYRLQYTGDVSKRVKFPVKHGDPNAVYCGPGSGPIFGRGYDMYTFGGTIQNTGGQFKLDGNVNPFASYDTLGMTSNDLNGGSMVVTELEVYGVAEPPPYKEFKQLVNDKRFSDVQFTVEGKTIHAHKIILVGRSDYFRAMFCDQMSEATTQKPIVMEDVTYRSFMGLLNYLYSNELPGDTDAIALVDMWRVADRYTMEGLKTYASFQITEKLDENNVVSVYVATVSKLPVMDNVKKACMVFISSNMSKVIHGSSFADLPHDMMLEIIQAAIV